MMEDYQVYIIIANAFILASFFKEGNGGLMLVFLGFIWIINASFCMWTKIIRDQRMRNIQILEEKLSRRKSR